MKRSWITCIPWLNIPPHNGIVQPLTSQKGSGKRTVGNTCEKVRIHSCARVLSEHRHSIQVCFPRDACHVKKWEHLYPDEQIIFILFLLSLGITITRLIGKCKFLHTSHCSYQHFIRLSCGKLHGSGFHEVKRVWGGTHVRMLTRYLRTMEIPVCVGPIRDVTCGVKRVSNAVFYRPVVMITEWGPGNEHTAHLTDYWNRIRFSIATRA